MPKEKTNHDLGPLGPLDRPLPRASRPHEAQPQRVTPQELPEPTEPAPVTTPEPAPADYEGTRGPFDGDRLL